MRLRRWLALAFVTSLAFGVLQSTAYAQDLTPSEVTSPSAEATPLPLPVAFMQDDDMSIRFGGRWSTVWSWASSAHSHRVSNRANSYALASFDGTGVAFVSRKGPDRGRARIYIDGVATATVDLYASSSQRSSVVWESPCLVEGTHTIKVVVLGTKQAASSGSWVAADAFRVVGSPNPAELSGTVVNNGNSKLVRGGRWSLSTRGGPFGGTSWRSTSKGSSVTMRFKGTAVAWMGRKDSGSGKAEVLLDGRRVAVISQYAPGTAERRVAWSASGLTDGVHNVTVRVLGSPGIKGGGTRVDVDAFLVNGSLLKAYAPTPFKYPWRTYIVIDKSSFKLYWVKNGLLIKTYPIAHGKPYTPTPSRVWRIDSKYYTDPSSVYGPRKMRLYRQVSTSRGYAYEYTRYAVHGTNQPWVIGTMASHGCIRMYNRDVLELWPQVPLGTMVVTRD